MATDPGASNGRSIEQATQSGEYRLPYHHYVSLDAEAEQFSSFKHLIFGLNYALGNLLVYKKIQSLEVKTWCDVGCGDGALISQLQPYFPSTTCCGFD